MKCLICFGKCWCVHTNIYGRMALCYVFVKVVIFSDHLWEMWFLYPKKQNLLCLWLFVILFQAWHRHSWHNNRPEPKRRDLSPPAPGWEAKPAGDGSRAGHTATRTPGNDNVYSWRCILPHQGHSLDQQKLSDRNKGLKSHQW